MTHNEPAMTSAYSVSRRDFVAKTSALTATVLAVGATTAAESPAPPKETSSYQSKGQMQRPFLTEAQEFRDVSRGNPKPYTLQGEELTNARLTNDSWRLEVTTDRNSDEEIKPPASIANPLTIAESTAITYEGLLKLGKTHGVKFIKAMQCLNIPVPLGQGLWEGVPLREVLRLCGGMENVRRIVYWGFHNNAPDQMFRSSLSLTQAMETAPGELPPFLAYRLNGQPIPLERGGPVRMIVPWAHGFKSIKWLQHIELTNDYRANDTYALNNNDPESHLKTAAYTDPIPKHVAVGEPVLVRGLVMSGLSGVVRVEAWLRRSQPGEPPVSEDPSSWNGAQWIPCQLAAPPSDWDEILPADVSAKQLLGFDATSGLPLQWPLRYSMISWSLELRDLLVGKYEIRTRAVDKNGFAQPEPRPMLKTGRNAIEVQRFEVG
ncbi:MAG: molybdopterin-dependent oxidoreductase [Aureliella sp.]